MNLKQSNTLRDGSLDGTECHVELTHEPNAPPVILAAVFQCPSPARGVILFAHGSGSGRHSPRNRAVATALNRAGFATLLVDLLTEPEARDRANVFDVNRLADRVAGVAEWLASAPLLSGLPIGYFGASTGSAAALIAAARRPELVSAIVSRGGRPDLAWSQLPDVKAPTLLIVGGDDEPVVGWNRGAFNHMTCLREVDVIPHASHLFEEYGALEKVSALATDWFRRHLHTPSDATATR